VPKVKARVKVETIQEGKSKKGINAGLEFDQGTQEENDLSTRMLGTLQRVL